MAGDSALTFVAVLKAKAGRRDNLQVALEALVGPTRAEPGCIDYVLFGLKDEPDTFWMREAWRDQRALDEHIARPHFQRFVEQMEGLLAEPLRLVALEEITG